MSWSTGVMRRPRHPSFRCRLPVCPSPQVPRWPSWPWRHAAAARRPPAHRMREGRRASRRRSPTRPACAPTGCRPSPDPKSTNSVSGRIPKVTALQLGVNTQLQAAERACQRLLPNIDGSFQQQVRQCAQAGICPPALVQQMLNGIPSFARCMRSRGVPNWPDPTLDSEGIPVFAISISKDGFDPHSSQSHARKAGMPAPDRRGRTVRRDAVKGVVAPNPLRRHGLPVANAGDKHDPTLEESVMSDSTRVLRRPRRAWPRTVRTASAIIGTAALALLVAACSGSGSSTGGSPHAGGSSTSPSAVAYSACMRSHGVPNFPDPGSGGQVPKADPQQLGVSSPQLQAAQEACAHLIPATGSTEEQQQETQCAMAGNCSQAVVQQWLSGLRTLARCLRSHGEPNWPDPIISSQGRNQGLPHFNYSQAGIDHHSAPVLAKVQVCIGLTGFEGLALP
jgi:hypothetical protein